MFRAILEFKAKKYDVCGESPKDRKSESPKSGYAKLPYSFRTFGLQTFGLKIFH